MENKTPSKGFESPRDPNEVESMQPINIPQPSRSMSATILKQDHSESNSTEANEHIAEIDLNPCSSKQNSNALLENGEYVTAIPIRKLETVSLNSLDLYTCRICHNGENRTRLVSPCLCKGTMKYVHIECLERWLNISGNTSCEMCQYQYKTLLSPRYSFLESLRIWYSRSMSRRALQEDCQMFSLLTLVAFAIIGTLLVAIQYYILQGNMGHMIRVWSKGWLIFFLFTTLAVYLVNVYMIVKSHLAPWYRWWLSTCDISLILESPQLFVGNQTKSQIQQSSFSQHHDSTEDQSSGEMPLAEGTTTANTAMKGTNGGFANSCKACSHHTADYSWSQDNETYNTNSAAATIIAVEVADTNADALYGTTKLSTLIFLPFTSPSNCLPRSNVLVTPYTRTHAIDNDYDDDDVMVSLAKYSNYNMAYGQQMWTKEFEVNGKAKVNEKYQQMSSTITTGRMEKHSKFTVSSPVVMSTFNPEHI
ncbi:uncharacterized protein LOC142241216 isoform X2 [Haematobia irritans]|uniref:uncharacterized protein LOC142241216 isoform X2 n=1 Tax=Haematobia irritans TaxID=7368 RepID=UPI003F4FD4FC